MLLCYDGIYLCDRTLYKLYLKEINVLSSDVFCEFSHMFCVFFILLSHINQMESDVQVIRMFSDTFIRIFVSLKIKIETGCGNLI